VLISWEHPANPNGDILSYSVSIADLGDGSTVRLGETVTNKVAQTNLGTKHSYLLCRCNLAVLPLVPGVPYNVSIAAVNRAGQGELSTFILFTRELGMK
jgi:hypothetical protein